MTMETQLIPVTKFLEEYNKILDDRYEIINAINKVKGCPDYQVSHEWIEAIKADKRSSMVVLYDKYLELDAKKCTIELSMIGVPKGLFSE